MVSFNACRTAPAVLFFSLLILFTGHETHAQDAPRSVRVLHQQLAATFEEAYLMSRTVRPLVDELEQSDLIIHVVGMGPDPHRHFIGMMTFVNHAGGRRFLRITINERLPTDRRAAALGHELQHALEVARARSVVDQETLAALYRTIGHESGDGSRDCYETDAAKVVGARVLTEFRAELARRRLGSAAVASGGSR